MNSPSSITPGQIVQLKTGGPQMTVASIEDNDGAPQALCIWHVEDEQHEQLFDVAALEVAELIED